MNDLCRTDKRIQKKKTVKNDINSTVGGFKKEKKKKVNFTYDLFC